jgi:hypothetical protein
MSERLPSPRRGVWATTFSLKVRLTPDPGAFAVGAFLDATIARLPLLAGPPDGYNHLIQRILTINHSPPRKVMPSLSGLDYYRSGKSLIRLVTLFLALAVAAPVLLAEDSDHDRDANHGQDPAIGSWVVHVHLTNFTPLPPFPLPFDFDNLLAIVEGGIEIGVAPAQGTSVGVWKNLGNRMYDTKLVQINTDGTIDTVLGDKLMLNQQGNEMRGPFTGFDTDPKTGKVIDQFSGTVIIDRITLHSTPF